MAANPLHVTVTGAAGQIGYALVHRIATGQLLGPDQPVVLRLLEIEPALPSLEGVVMELEDGAHPLLVGIEATADLKTAFDGTSWALLVGSIPRKAGMERGDLLSVNGGIFKPQGQAINDHAASDVRVLVVGNPCNTNCLIARSNAPDVPADRWFAMTRLDENRAKTQLAKKAGVLSRQVSNVAIWGNHSATQFPDFAHARIDGTLVPEVITDTAWLQGEFIETVQKRGAAVIEKRGASSAASAAHAAIDSVNSVHFATPGDDFHSVAVCSSGQYGVPEGLQFGYPIRSDGSSWTVVEGIEHDDFAQGKIDDRPPRSSPTSATRFARSASSRDFTALLKRWSLQFADDQGLSGSMRLQVDGVTASFHAQVVVPDVGVLVVRDDEVAPPRRTDLLVVRAEGLWAELLCETPDEHWSFGLEAFGVRFDAEAEAASSDRGERVRRGLRPRVGDPRPSRRRDPRRPTELRAHGSRYVLDQRGAQRVPGGGRAPSTR